MANQIIDDIESRERAMNFLRGKGWQYIQQPDWCAVNGDDWTVVEVKNKDLFTPGNNFPHFGIGLDKSQLFLRRKFQEGTGLRTYLINFVPDTDEGYGAYLDELDEKGGYYDTPGKIRIYPLEHFEKFEVKNG